MKRIQGGLAGGAQAGVSLLGRVLSLAGMPAAPAKARLEEIRSELDALAQDAQQVYSSLDQLSEDVQVSLAQLEELIDLTQVDGPAGLIEAPMIFLCSLVSDGRSDCTRLSPYLHRPDSGSRPGTRSLALKPADVQEFAEYVLGPWDVVGEMQSLHNALADPGHGALNAFVDLAIQRLEAQPELLVPWHSYLEQSFVKWVTVLQYGMILHCSALSVDIAPDQEATLAANWIENTYQGMLNDVVTAFKAAAERIRP